MSLNAHDINLDAFHDGELPADERARVQMHLDECEQCRAELVELVELSQQIRALHSPAPVLSQIERERLKRGILPKRAASVDRPDVLMLLAGRLTRFAAGLLIVGTGAISMVLMNSSHRQQSSWEEIASQPQSMLSENSSAQSSLAEWVLTDLDRGGVRR